MIDEVNRLAETAGDITARRLATETGITPAQAAELVSILGPHNWSSLLREAGMLKKSSPN